MATVEQWRDALLPVLISRLPGYRKLRNYHDGEHTLPTAPDRASDKYLRLAKMGVTNMCGLVVGAPAAKLTPIGVRVSTATPDGVVEVDDTEFWRLVWKSNHLNADCRPVHEESLKVGRGAMLVWPGGPSGVSVTVEDPDQVIVAYDAGSRRRRSAALKFHSDGLFDRVTVWTPLEVFAWQRPAGTDKEWSVDDDETTRGVNPLGAVPVIEFLCNPDIKGTPQPELSTAVLNLQDRINKTMFDAVVAGEDGAFPQRYGIGIEMETDANGDPINPLVYGPNRTWILKSDDPNNPSGGQIGQLQAFDNAPILRLADTSIRQLGWISRTSAIFMLGGSSNVGADMIRALDDGHKTKVLAHQMVFGEAYEEVFRLSAKALKREVGDIEVMWASPEFRSPAEMADAAIKMRQAGYPFAAIARHMGESPAEVERLVAERRAELEAGTAADEISPPGDLALVAPISA